MDKENIDADMTKSLQELLVEADRVNDIFAQNISHLKEDSKGILTALPRLTLEIEHIKKTRENLSSCLAEKMQEAYLKESEAFSDRLSTAFLEKAEKGLEEQQKQYESSLNTISDAFHDQIHREKQDIQKVLDTYSHQAKEISQKYLMDAEKFRQEMEKAVSSMTRLMSLQKQRLTRKGLLICGVFCIASALTGSGLFYLFPQHVYHPDKNIPQNIIMGKVTRENFGKFSSKDQDMLLEEVRKYMRGAK